MGCCDFSPSPGIKPEDRQPFLITDHQGVKLWGVRRYYGENPHSYTVIYFTTPSGDVQWPERQGKVNVDVQTLGSKGTK